MRYHYTRSDTGATVEVIMTIGEMLRRQKSDGSILLTKAECGETGKGRIKAVRNMASEMRGVKATPGAWPQVSQAAGVMPDQRDEAIAHAIAKGVPTDFNAEGDAIFRDRKHRNDYLRAVGMFDRGACYGDHAGNNV